MLHPPSDQHSANQPHKPFYEGVSAYMSWKQLYFEMHVLLNEHMKNGSWIPISIRKADIMELKEVICMAAISWKLDMGNSKYSIVAIPFYHFSHQHTLVYSTLGNSVCMCLCKQMEVNRLSMLTDVFLGYILPSITSPSYITLYSHITI